MMPLNIDEPYLIEERNIVLIPTSGDYNDILPDDAKLIKVKGYTFWAVPNTPAFNAALYGIGLPVPSPIYFSDYDWSDIQIYSAQAQMAGLVSSRHRCYNLSQMGAGKTIGSLLAVDWLIESKVVKHALIVAPLSILWSVWQAEIEKYFFRLVPVVLHGPKERRVKLIHSKFWNVAIINNEGLGVIQQELLDRKFQMIIIDEVASFRDQRTERWKRMQRIMDHAEYAVGLTGSPTPNTPSDAYGIARLLTPWRAPKSFKAFRETVELYLPGPNKWVAKKDAPQKVAKLLQPAVRFMRSEIVEIAPAKAVHQHVALSPEQQHAVMELKKNAIIAYPEGIVKAVNAAVLWGKLLQICAGAVYTTEKQVIDLHARQRMALIDTLIEGAEGKVIILAPYIHVVDLIHDEISKKHKAATVYGKTPAADRAAIFRAFQDPRDPLRVINAHPRVLAHGLNLTQADTVIWYAPILSREIYEQANDRIMRIGQTRQPYVVHLSSGIEEDAAYDILERKGTMQDATLKVFQLRTSAAQPTDPTVKLDEELVAV